jgi:hypothetical protein
LLVYIHIINRIYYRYEPLRTRCAWALYKQAHIAPFFSDLSVCNECVGNVVFQLLVHHAWFNLLNNNKSYEPVLKKES